MIKFFRKIRQRLLTENKISKYLIYATGEILLVVIGILIAFQIDTWNESRSINNSLKLSKQALLYDLKQDSIRLMEDIKFIQKDLARLYSFNERLSNPYSTIDTLKKIARYEYLPFFNPSNELNKSTITSLLSTGNIEYFNDNLKSKMLKHNADQLELQKVMDQNVSIFLGSQYAKGPVMQSENPNSLLQSAVIRGPLLERYWASKGDDQFLDRMLSTISGKIIMYKILLASKEELLLKTNEMIVFLIDIENQND